LILTKDQEIALNSIKLWWQQRNLKQLYFLNGYAGTGKTTLIRYVIDDLKLDLTRIAFIAFTGKAALVIQQKHLFPATTIHKKIYKSYYDEKTNKLISIRRSKKEMEDIDLFILDECSMVSKKLMKDLLSFNKPIICIGDTFQLPPVSSESYFYKGFNPDSTLEEITRQSLDNPIIKLSMDIRENKWPKRGLYGESILINFYDFIDINYLLQADQVICGYNHTRINVNRWFRNKLFGYIPDKPVIGDKIICLKKIIKIQKLLMDNCLL
jgi:exodeoxyribonuclease-5